jgi:hypothetical protein
MQHDVDEEFLVDGSSSCSCNGGQTFPALKRLKVNAYMLRECTALLSIVISPSLVSISFSYDVQAPCTLFEGFFRQVQRTSESASAASSLSFFVLSPTPTPAPFNHPLPQTQSGPLLELLTGCYGGRAMGGRREWKLRHWVV